MTGGKKLRLRWAATCAGCGAALVPGDQAWWFHLEDIGRCMTCMEPPTLEARPAAVVAATRHRRTSSPPPPRRRRLHADPAGASTPGHRRLRRRCQTASPVPPVQADSSKAPVRSAGASAQAEYERRRSNDRARIRQNLPQLLPVVVAAPFVGYFGVRIGAVVVDGQFRSLASSAAGGADTGPMFDAGLVNLVGLCAAFAFTLSAARLAFGSRQSTEAWRIGAEGERLTGRALQKLPAPYRVFHDLPMPRSKANIDHVVIGPTGVFTVETKNYKNGVKIKGGRVYGSGRSLSGVVGQARRQAAAMAAKTGATVTPIVCVHGGGVTVEGLFQKPVVDGVRFCSGRRLTKTIADYPARLDDQAIDQLVRRLT